MFKPELLLPAGSLETFFAAVEGGADAVYLGLRKFNARNRAKNFSPADLFNLINEAHNQGKKIYVTINTLVKNEELFELIDVLSVLSQANVDAIIVQDMAVANIAAKYFRNLNLHASTQMAIHNSAGCNYLANLGFSRIVLARELTMNEMSSLSKSVKVETEVFVHGALCYSFSGQCLFSSYLGGNSANRGLCTQVCRRCFKSENMESQIFSMKDFQLIDLIPFYSKLKISSLKVEGRMKSADYVYNVAKAYRMAIDDYSKIEDAKELLKSDFAREKTSWFMGCDVKNAITTNAGTGIFVGKISLVEAEKIEFVSDIELNQNSKLRIRNNIDTEAEYIKFDKLEKIGNKYLLYCEGQKYFAGWSIYLVGSTEHQFKTKFKNYVNKNFKPISYQQKESIKKSFPVLKPKDNRQRLFLRISNLNVLKKINPSTYDAVFAKFSFSDMEKLLTLKLPKETKQKVHVELPKFISEIQLDSVSALLKKLFFADYTRFVISNFSQLQILPSNSFVSTNESIYLMNDISINFIKSQHIKYYCYPQETDYPNLIAGRDRNGIIPIYFYPELFYSRMPVAVKKFTDENKKLYLNSKVNGVTVITDSNPVAWTQNISKFRNKGFNNFLIDISRENDLTKLSEILQHVKLSSKVPKTNDFNMKKGLK